MSKRTFYTSAPQAYDGFSTRTVKIVGEDPRSGEPVRKVECEERDYVWQTSRYDSGSCRYTSDRVPVSYYTNFGDWHLSEECNGCGPNMPRADKRPAYVKAIEAERDEIRAERDALQEQVNELVAYLSLDKFQGAGNDYVNVRDVLTRLGR